MARLCVEDVQVNLNPRQIILKIGQSILTVTQKHPFAGRLDLDF